MNRYMPVVGKCLLVQGSGSGWDTLSWGQYKPERIIAQELYPFPQAWQQCKHYMRSRDLPVPEFIMGKLEQIPLRSESIDLVVSDAVFEHCQDLEAVLLETHRILKPGGYVYAGYGPLWFCFGGDHFSGRGGSKFGYSHIELSRSAYTTYYQLHKLSNEDAQSGGRYMELDLFSKLATKQYLALFEKTGFQVVDLLLEISAEALEFKRTWPGKHQGLLQAHPEIVSEDLLIKANLAILRKTCSASSA